MHRARYHRATMGEGDDRAIGALLKRYRVAAGLTQEELAERAEVSARTVSDTERGLRTSIYRDTAKRLADALGLDEDDKARFEQAARKRIAAPLVGARFSVQAPPTQLIGREPELALLSEAWNEGARLVTLTGPGGIGKTRLAQEFAGRGDSASTAWIPLGGTDDPRLVLQTIAHAVGAPPGIEPVSAIADRVNNAGMLVVLDTFEHLLDAAGDVAAFLAACPEIRVLVTSREALHLRGEREIAIQTLELPRGRSLEDVARAPATALLLERLRAVRPETIDDDAAAVVAEICDRLNGVPLAIELAAARAKHMTLAAVNEQLTRSLDVLTGGARDLPKRQQTMRDTVAWSDGLLDENERKRFRELSVFAGGWTLDAAAAVCEGSSDVLTVVSALVDKSLVILDASGEEPRYRMLDVIREYAAEQRGDEQDAGARHMTYFANLAKKAEPELGLAAQDEWFRRLVTEQDNFRAALRWAIERLQVDQGLRMTGDLWQFWRSNGDLNEGRQWLREALAMSGGDQAARAKALWGAAWLAYHQGDFVDAGAQGALLKSLAGSLDDPVITRNALTIEGMVAMAHDRAHDALPPFEQAVSIMRHLGQSWLLATSLLNLGSSYMHTGDEEHAISALEEATALYRRLGDRHFAARATIQLGFAWLESGDRARAGALIRESLIEFTALGDEWGTVEALEATAALHAAQGKPERAARIAGAAAAFRTTMTVLPLPFDIRFTHRWLDVARAEDEAAFANAWSEGENLSRDEAIEESLADA